MKLLLKKSIRNDSDFLNMKTATKTFRIIMERQMKESKFKPKKILPKKSDKFFNMITRDFFKQEIKEKDQEYMHKEIKLIQKNRQNLIDLYGKNAKNVILPPSPEPVKYDKKLLFNPIQNESNKRNSITFKFGDIIFSEEKKSNLPKIYLNKNISKLVKNNNLNIKIRNRSENIDKYNISRYNSLNTESSSKHPKIYSTYSKPNNNWSKISNSSESNQFNKNEYLSTLDSLYEDTIYSQRRQKRYFNSCNYGYSFYKNKINYIYQTLFNK